MKSVFFLLFVFVAICYAKCDCDAADNTCMSKCVVEANSCVTSCKEDITCYESCIDDKWPSADAAKAISQATFKEVLAATTTTATPTNSVPASTSARSAMGSSSAGSTSVRPSAVSTGEVSLGSTLKMPTTVPLLAIFLILVLV